METTLSRLPRGRVIAVIIHAYVHRYVICFHHVCVRFVPYDYLYKQELAILLHVGCP